MVRGNSLGEDLKLLVNNPHYSDLEIKCKDGVVLHGNRAILAARSEVFDRMLFTRGTETPDKQVSFLKIEASTMKIILEYLYTGSISNGALTTDNTFETLNAADFFQLKNLQDLISNFYMQICEKEGIDNKSPELLSKAVQLMSSSANNGVIDFLVDKVSKISLDTIGFDRLSIQALQCLLSKSNDETKIFKTSEYSVLRMAILLAVKNVSQEAFFTLKKRLPLWDKIEDGFDFNNNDIPDIKDICTSTANILAPIIEFIDLRRIEGKILIDIIEPLNLISSKKLMATYRFYAYEKNFLPPFRGIRCNFKWDKNGCGPHLSISSNGYMVSSNSDGGAGYWESVKTTYLMSSGVNKLHVRIKDTERFIIGIGNERVDYSNYVGTKGNGWGYFSGGYTHEDGLRKPLTHNKPLIGQNNEVIMNLNMENRTCVITVNGTENVVRWANLPSNLYFVGSLDTKGRIKIIR
ncbi:11201_t:CDS:1 [Acaulospora colombiana]|uniref:11201_t:CDS:1 n=1 Tax=Acaulospora colombiana TaxID=27376 RepID=A0ACA9N5G5_9GLOM|nr:11201_t:CDS:1 [Acaulospora colombiana]